MANSPKNQSPMRYLTLLLLAVVTFTTTAKPTIRWAEEECRYVCRGGYARIRAVGERFAMVHSSGRALYIRFSDDECRSWGEATKVAEAEGYLYTNSELLVLQSGHLLYTWNARPLRDTGLPYKIMYATSEDGGNHWSEGVTLYTAGTTPRTGCWEPVAMQLPSGELHLYFANEAPYLHTSEQEISLLRSYDEGRSWSNAERVSFRKGKRDGMAVPIYLPHTGEIAVAIEDNGVRGSFKPVIVRTRANWRDGFVSGNDTRREEALTTRWSVEDTVYAGAPYLIRLGKRHTLLSVQTTEGRKGKGHKYANMQVYVGDRNARNFGNRTTPLPHLEEDGCALWNSLTQIDEKRVIAVMSVKGMGKNGIWTAIGEIVKR